MEAHPYPPDGYPMGVGIQTPYINGGANYAMQLPPGCVMNYGPHVVKPEQQQQQQTFNRTEFNKVEVDADHSGAGYEDDDDLC